MMDIITLDKETFYDQEYSLTKLTTEEYIRDKRFEIIGVGVKVNDEDTDWYSGSHSYIRKCLLQYDWEGSIAVAHNAMFDMAILSWILDIHPARIADTLSMARAIHGLEVGNSLAKLAEYYQLGVKGTEVVNAKGKRRADFSGVELEAYGGYCKNDVDLTYGIFNKLLPHFNVNELKVIDQTIKMFSEPVLRLDGAMLEEHLVEVVARKEKLLRDSGVDKKDLMSNEKFAGLLRGLGVEPPTKISKTTGKEAYAFAKTDEEFKSLLSHPLQEVQVLCSARIGNKSTIEETRTQRFIDISKRGLIPVPLSYYGAHTGRYGGADKINLQNLPSRTKEVSKLKEAILAPDGHVLINCDSSQIEARVLAWFAGQLDLLDDFKFNRDPYRKMAGRIYGIDPVDIPKDSHERFVGKETILGAGYMMAGLRFQAQLKTKNVYIELEEAIRIIRVYRDNNPYIVKLWDKAGRALDAMLKGQTFDLGQDCVLVEPQGIKLPNGLYLKYPNLRKECGEDGKWNYVYDQGRKTIKIYSGKLVENLIQALAFCIIKEQAILVARRYRWAFNVHDSVVAVAPEDGVEEAMKYVMECMRHVPKWAEGVPLDCEAGYSRSYGGC